MDVTKDPNWPRRVMELMDGKGAPSTQEATKATTEPFIYFIGEAEPEHVKIGYALRPERRLVDLQIGNPRRLYIHATADGGSLDEARLHRYFEAHREGGEWFRMNDELRWLMCELGAGLTPPKLPHVVKAEICRLFGRIGLPRRFRTRPEHSSLLNEHRQQPGWFLAP